LLERSRKVQAFATPRPGSPLSNLTLEVNCNEKNRAAGVLVALIGGFAAGFRTALAREHSHLEHNKQILRRVHSEVWSNPDLNAAMKAADELYTPDFVLHDWTGDSRGVNEVKKGVSETRAAFPDSRERKSHVLGG
jgi:hypothetical protein